MFKLLILCLLSSALAATVVVEAVNSDEDSSTAIQFAVTHSTSGFAAIGTKVQVSRDPDTQQGVVNASAEIDARKISLSTPVDGGDLAFYYGALNVDAKAELTPTYITASINGALAELGVAFHTIFVYYNRDGEAGFKWNNLDTEIFNCSGQETFDCIDAGGVIRLKEDLDWGDLVYQTPQECPPPEDNTIPYTAECRIYTAEISAYVPGTNEGTHVITFTFHVSNQPVIVNGNTLPSGHAKVDVNITYPWDDQVLDGSSGSEPPRVGLSLLAAGKVVVGEFEGTAVTVEGQKGYKWGSAAYATTWRVADNADIDGNTNNGQVYYGSYTGQEIMNHTCGLIITECLNSPAQCFVCGLKITAQFYNAFGWNTRILWYSWDNEKPTEIYWDPVLSLEDEETAVPSVPTPEPEDNPPAGSASSSVVSLLMSVFVLVFVFF